VRTPDVRGGMCLGGATRDFLEARFYRVGLSHAMNWFRSIHVSCS
jgi:hypothetical protein